MCPSHEKVNLLSSGLNTIQINIPNNPVNKLHERTNLTVSVNFISSSLSKYSEIFLTALIETPKLVELLIRLKVELNNDISPIPSGPNIIATNLFLTTPTNILSV